MSTSVASMAADAGQYCCSSCMLLARSSFCFDPAQTCRHAKGVMICGLSANWRQGGVVIGGVSSTVSLMV